VNTKTIGSKLPKTGTTIFTVMSQLANECQAINLSQGFPDFEVSKKLIELVNHYMQKGMNQYAPMPGVMILREAISKKVEEDHSRYYNPETEITITAGGTQALYTAIAALVREGDEVIVLEPYYDSYVPAIELNGGQAVFVQLKTPEYKVDWEKLKKVINQRTRMIIINTPHNPTSTVWSKSDMEMLEKHTKDTEIIILSDEVYEHIIFDQNKHESVIKYPKLAERSLVVFSFGKTFHATGWKTGYCMAPDYLMKEFRKAHQFIVFSGNTPIQYALADFLKDKSNYTGLSQYYQKKRDYFSGMIQQTKFKPLAVSGSYFQLVTYGHLSDEKDTEYAIRLTREFGVATIPVSVFYHKPVDNKILRLCFAKTKETLDKAAERLCKI
jgi:methionine aminotransferase